MKINDLLYGKTHSHLFQQHTSKESVLHAVLLGSGLNKIMPNPRNHKVKSYRGERHTSEQEIQERIKFVKQGGGYTDRPAFLSTSTSQSVANNFKGKCMIIFDSVYGADVRKLSSVIGESEFLLPPGQIYWKGYEYINGCHTFRADAVRPLIPAKDEHHAEDVDTFNKLLQLAHQKGVPYHFVTPTLHNHISDPQIKAAVVSAKKPVPPQVTRKELIQNGLAAVGLFGLGLFMLSVGLGFIPAFASASWTLTLIGSALTYVGYNDLKNARKEYNEHKHLNAVPAAVAQAMPAPIDPVEPSTEPSLEAVQPATVPGHEPQADYNDPRNLDQTN